MNIPRPEYLEALVKKQWNGRIKVVTGLRRCGKSYILMNLFVGYLLSNGVKRDEIIDIALDDIRYEEYHDPGKLYSYLSQKTQDVNKRYYILIDEIQYAISREELMDRDRPPRLYACLNALLRQSNVDVYVTGSNSKLLSRDVMTEFRGRGDEIGIFPLSFAEIMAVSTKSREETFREYLLFGGLPLAVTTGDADEKMKYLSSLFSEVYFKDIVERANIRDTVLLGQLVDALCSSAGSLVNTNKLANSINSIQQRDKTTKVANTTVASYLEQLEYAYLFSSAKRYDIRGKRYFESMAKWYCCDSGLRNARLNFRQSEVTHLMETVIYNHLLQKGCMVDVGMIEKNGKNADGKSTRTQYEIDFVVNRASFQCYIQSAWSLEGEGKEKAELYPFSITGDDFRKIVVTRDELMPHYDEHGIFRVGIIDFLLGDYLV